APRAGRLRVARAAATGRPPAGPDAAPTRPRVRAGPLGAGARARSSSARYAACPGRTTHIRPGPVRPIGTLPRSVHNDADSGPGKRCHRRWAIHLCARDGMAMKIRGPILSLAAGMVVAAVLLLLDVTTGHSSGGGRTASGTGSTVAHASTPAT